MHILYSLEIPSASSTRKIRDDIGIGISPVEDGGPSFELNVPGGKTVWQRRSPFLVGDYAENSVGTSEFAQTVAALANEDPPFFHSDSTSISATSRPAGLGAVDRIHETLHNTEQTHGGFESGWQESYAVRVHDTTSILPPVSARYWPSPILGQEGEEDPKLDTRIRRCISAKGGTTHRKLVSWAWMKGLLMRPASTTSLARWFSDGGRRGLMYASRDLH
ncbi:unnamed protein product [Cyclocybe aegerita]|uniref:Uncharacterized protein n=1 Tax=Cyclocybe aegerita TaxID=1973307 RepID=A0A8S0XXI4_CYCAE|nr:unnamed protein product [Cyclocybe aegerita]